MKFLQRSYEELIQGQGIAVDLSREADVVQRQGVRYRKRILEQTGGKKEADITESLIISRALRNLDATFRKAAPETYVPSVLQTNFTTLLESPEYNAAWDRRPDAWDSEPFGHSKEGIADSVVHSIASYIAVQLQYRTYNVPEQVVQENDVWNYLLREHPENQEIINEANALYRFHLRNLFYILDVEDPMCE